MPIRASHMAGCPAGILVGSSAYVRHFRAQIDNELTHIWRQAPRRFLWLLSRPGSEEANHTLLIKSVSFTLQAGAWLACVPLSSIIWRGVLSTILVSDPKT